MNDIRPPQYGTIWIFGDDSVRGWRFFRIFWRGLGRGDRRPRHSHPRTTKNFSTISVPGVLVSVLPVLVSPLPRTSFRTVEARYKEKIKEWNCKIKVSIWNQQKRKFTFQWNSVSKLTLGAEVHRLVPKLFRTEITRAEHRLPPSNEYDALAITIVIGSRKSSPGQYFLHFQNAGRQGATRETITGVHSLTEYSV